MNPYILHTDNHARFPSVEVGGKARNLFKLKQQGLPVPDFICITSLAFEECLRPVIADIKRLLDGCHYDDLQSVTETSRQITRQVMECELSPAVQQALHESLQSLRQWPSFSVRSSAANEDGLKSSFAGQLGTWLNVSFEQIERKVIACWASAFEPGILTYMHKMQRDPLHNQVSVVVQRMVVAKSAGVLFQADPQGNINRQVIVAGYGLGEGIVSDKVESDLYYHDKRSGEWQLQINEKLRQLGYGESGGTQEFAVTEELRNQAVLSDAQRQQLVQQSAGIAAIYDHFQDVEWAFDQQDTLYILQARPITTIPKGFQRVFDSSNIAESYPGVVLPMTVSIFHLDYYHCIKDGLARCGAPASVIEKREDVLQHLIGYINGRAYYNLNNWYRTLLLVPFFKKKIVHYFEQMIGTEGSFDEDLDDLTLTRWEEIKIAVRFPILFLKNMLTHERLLQEYFGITGDIRREFEALDLGAASSDELTGFLMHSTKRLMKSLSIPILNDFFAMIFMAVTRERFAKSGIPDAENLLNRLLANQQIESTKPVVSMNALVEKIRADNGLAQFIESLLGNAALSGVSDIYQALITAGYRDFQTGLKTHLDLYGHRSPKELIMEADTFRENPFHLLRILLESSKAPPLPEKARDDAEAELARHVGSKRLLNWLLKKTRQAVAYREATRLDRGLHFSYLRTTLHHLGQRLVEEGVLAEPRDVFYLTLPELDAYRKGCTPNSDLNGLVAYRKTQVEKWRALEPEERIFTSGSVYANKIPEKSQPLDLGAASLKGTGCSDGQITMEARIVKNPNAESDVKGRILVSETTDPGWVFLMVLSGGLISERGSLLSHTAIIGRELGIPTIVGVKNATRYIQDGDMVTMNGKTGEVQIHR